MNIVRQSAVMIIVAMGVTFVMISGELDLSIGEVASLTGMVVSKILTYRRFYGDIHSGRLAFGSIFWIGKWCFDNKI